MTHEEYKQDLLDLINNADVEKLFELDPDWHFFYAINKYHNIRGALLKCQKRPTLEQQLEAMGFKYVILELQTCGMGLYFSVDRNKSDRIIIRFNRSDNNYQYYSAAFDLKNDIDNILLFAKYLVELKNAEES